MSVRLRLRTVAALPRVLRPHCHQAQLVKELLRDASLPVLACLTGDLNALPGMFLPFDCASKMRYGGIKRLPPKKR